MGKLFLAGIGGFVGSAFRYAVSGFSKTLAEAFVFLSARWQ